MAQFAGTRHLDVGLAGTGEILLAKRVRDVNPKIDLLDANNNALLTLIKRLRKKPATDVKFEWFEDVELAKTITITAAAQSSTDTTLTATSAAHAARARAFDLWMVGDSGEIVYVQSVTAAVLTVVREIGGTAAEIASGDTLYYVGNAQPSGHTARAKVSTIVSQKTGFCQIFEEGWEIAKDAAKTRMYGGPERDYLRMKHAEEHMRSIDRGLWVGDATTATLTPTQTGQTGKEAYVMKGFFPYLSTNTHTNSTGELTDTEFFTYMEDDFRYGNAVKFMFCSPKAMTVIANWALPQLELIPKDTTYGISITRLKTPHGELNLINNKLFKDLNDTGATYNYGACSAIVDLESLYYRELRGTELQMNIQGTDEDTFEDQYLTQCGLELHHEKRHAEIYDWDVS
jgi:hypothetical protein